METKLGQEPAFPNDNTIYCQPPDCYGMSKRFYAACYAMNGFLSNTDFIKELGNQLKNEPNNEKFNECICSASYMVADELLKQESIFIDANSI